MRTAALREATRLIAARGFAAVSLQEIADGIGVTKQALLYHFKTKDALKLAVIDHLLERGNKSLTAMLGGLSRDDERRVDEILAYIQQELQEEPHTASVLLRFLLDRDEAAVDRIQAGARPWFRVIEDAVRSGQQAGLVRPELDPEAMVLQVGMLVITNFALLPIDAWANGRPAAWKRRRLEELVRAIRLILFSGSNGAAAPAGSTRGRSRSRS